MLWERWLPHTVVHTFFLYWAYRWQTLALDPKVFLQIESLQTLSFHMVLLLLLNTRVQTFRERDSLSWPHLKQMVEWNEGSHQVWLEHTTAMYNSEMQMQIRMDMVPVCVQYNVRVMWCITKEFLKLTFLDIAILLLSPCFELLSLYTINNRKYKL